MRAGGKLSNFHQFLEEQQRAAGHRPALRHLGRCPRATEDHWAKSPKANTRDEVIVSIKRAQNDRFDQSPSVGTA
jgi:hypothetical protein